MDISCIGKKVKRRSSQCNHNFSVCCQKRWSFLAPCWCFSGFWLTLYANNGRVLPKEPRIQQTPRLCQRLSGWNSKHLHIKYNTPTLTQINTADKLPENIHFSLYTPWLVLNGCLTGVKCLQCVGMKWGWGGAVASAVCLSPLRQLFRLN